MKPKTKAFPFMRLPVELRAEIYDYVFPKGQEIKIAEKNRAGIKTRLKRQQGLKSTNTKTEGGATLSTHIRWQRPSGLSLLHVSKQILNEAAPVAYGNAVLLCPDNYITRFLKELGSMRKHLKNVRITESGTHVGSHDHIRQSLVGFVDAENVRSISFDHAIICGHDLDLAFRPEYDMSRMTRLFANALWLMVKKLVAGGQTLDAVVEKVRIEVPGSWIYGHNRSIMGGVLPCGRKGGEKPINQDLGQLEKSIHACLRQRHESTTERLQKMSVAGDVISLD
jgi:hypothetical protein